MVPTLFSPWGSLLVAIADPQPGARVLDVGCGTGVVARLVAARIASEGRIVGLDVSASMLAVARAMAEREGLSIEWCHGRAESLPFSDASFDLVLCQFALMFFADQRTALAEMHRVAAPGATVFLTVWQGLQAHPFHRKLHEVIERETGTSSVKEMFGLGDAAHLKALLQHAGFRGVEIAPMSMTARFPDPEGFLAGEIDVDTAAILSLHHVDARERQQILSAIATAMIGPLREVTRNDHVVIPFHAHVARARRRR